MNTWVLIIQLSLSQYNSIITIPNFNSQSTCQKQADYLTRSQNLPRAFCIETDSKF